MKENWKELSKYIAEKLHTTPLIVDLIAVYDILELSASGFSNASISRRLDMDIEYVKDAIVSYLGFDGYIEDLMFNPYSVFSRSVSYEDFLQELHILQLPLDNITEICYTTSIKFDLIRKELDNYYAKAS